MPTPIAEIEGMRVERKECFDRLTEINDKSAEEKRSLTGEEQQEYDRVESRMDELGAIIERTEKLQGISGLEGRTAHPETPATDVEEDEKDAPVSLTEYNERRQAELPQDAPEYRTAFFHMLTARDVRDLEPAEHRALSKATAAAGANLVPTGFQRTLIDVLREFGVMRQVATVISTTSGEALQLPSVTSHGTASWTAENAAYTESDEVFGQLTLNAYKAATIIKVSEELLSDSAFNLESYIAREFGQRIGVLQNTAYVVGDGSGKPTGVATQATAGVTAATNAAITADELVDLYHSLLPPYRARASWLLKDSSIKSLRKLKDTTNQYLWQPGLTAGAPDTLLGRPVLADPDMAAIGTVAISALFGDFSYYWIRDAGGISFQRLEELYAANGQVGFRAFHRTDGKLTQTAAVKKLTHPV